MPLMDRTAKGDRRREDREGDDTQDGITGGGEPGSSAARTAASAHGAPTPPFELNNAPYM